MDIVAFLSGLLGVASLVPATMSARTGFPSYRPWYVRALVAILVGLVLIGVGLVVSTGGDALYWVGVLLVATGVVLVWALRLRTRSGIRHVATPRAPHDTGTTRTSE
ncbi:hypothetical protein [Actinoplanes philippinensis]|uniref:hypothetical protein n=1 Tax=Actinoplanes philippinensis TaxID=35752 RepID=UPI0033DC475C